MWDWKNGWMRRQSRTRYVMRIIQMARRIEWRMKGMRCVDDITMELD